jgi:hypothetical protein
MTRYKGHEGAATVGASSIGEIESFDIELSVNELDANVMGVGWTDVEAGQSSASGSITVLRDPDDAGQAALVLGGAGVSLTLFTEGNTTGLTEISGTFMVTSQGISTSVGDLVKTTYQVRNKGTVTVGSVT